MLPWSVWHTVCSCENAFQSYVKLIWSFNRVNRIKIVYSTVTVCLTQHSTSAFLFLHCSSVQKRVFWLPNGLNSNSWIFMLPSCFHWKRTGKGTDTESKNHYITKNWCIWEKVVVVLLVITCKELAFKWSIHFLAAASMCLQLNQWINNPSFCSCSACQLLVP